MQNIAYASFKWHIQVHICAYMWINSLYKAYAIHIFMCGGAPARSGGNRGCMAKKVWEPLP